MKRALVVVLGALALATSSPLVAAQESSTAPAEVSMPAAPAPADVRTEASAPANMAAPAGSGESAAAAAAPTGESGSGVITGVPAGAHSVEVPKSENSGKIAGALSAAEASAAARDGRTVQRAASGRVTIVDNSNRLNMVAEKPQYDEVTAARIAQDRLKMDMEEHQKKLDALAREELAEQNGKSEESNKLNAQKMKQQHESTTSAEEKSKVAHEELQKKTAKDNAAEADAKRDAQEKAMAAGQREAIEEASAKSAAHAKQKAALADGSWQKDSNGNVVNADKAVGLSQFNNYGGGWAQAVSRVVGQVCVVSGLVRGPGGGHVGTLDASCRPGGGRLIFNQMVGGSDSRVDVLADGRVYHIVAGNPPDYLSLAGVTFDTNPGASLTLYNGWNNYGSGYRPRSLARLGSHCIASGLISSGPWGLIGAVSSDCVPNERLIFSSNNHASVTRTDIVNNGQIYYAGGSANYGWVSLDGMIYSPGNGGTDISLAWPWTNYGGGYRGARYSVSSGVCAVSGLIRTQAGWSSRLFTLPAECRPKGNIIFATNAHDRSVRVDVHPDGTVDFVGNTGSYGWISLSNIHFVVA